MPLTTRSRRFTDAGPETESAEKGWLSQLARRAVLAFVVLITVFTVASPAAADFVSQDDEAVTEVRGTMRTTDEGGEVLFVEGVRFTVTAEDGTEIGEAATDAEGEWSVEVPGPGTYVVLLDESTLPDGLPLRNPDKNPLTVTVNPGASRTTLFPLGEATSSTDTTVEFVQLTVDGIKLGLIIGMSAIGLSLIYGTTGLTNFAHGEMVTFGAMIAFLFSVTGIFGWTTNLLLATVLSFIVCGIAGGVFNATVWRPLRRRGASLIAALVASLGFSILFRYMMLYQFGGRAEFYTDYQLQDKYDFGWFSIAPKDLFIVVFSIGGLLLIALALQKTRAGKAMRAVADNRDLAESSGIDVELVIKWVWVAGSALAGLGGVLFGLTESIGWEMGFRILLLMFAAVTLGGLGSAYGALLGSLIVGIFIQVSTMVIPSDMKNVGALLMLMLILLVKPEGLLGRGERIG
jgi:neutral amino acid transport system permease protein